MSRLGDAEVKAPVDLLGQCDVAIILALHRLNHRRQPVDSGIVDQHRGEGAGFAFDQRPRFEDLERAEIGRIGFGVGRHARGDIDAGAGAHFDQSIELERENRFAHRRPRDTGRRRNVAFGRQARADGIIALRNLPRQSLRDLGIKATAIVARGTRHRNHP